MNKRSLLAIILLAPVVCPQSASAFIVFDIITESNTTQILQQDQAIAIDTKNISAKTNNISKKTDNISEKTDKILETVQQTLKAITGDRKQDTKTKKAASPSADEVFANIDRALDALKDASDGVKVQYEQRSTKDNKTNTDPLIESVSRTSTDMSSFIKATLGALKIRRLNYETVSQGIGTTKDIKESIDQNSQIQVQNGLLLNELSGINNNILASQQSDSRNRTANIYNSMSAMSYNDN